MGRDRNPFCNLHGNKAGRFLGFFNVDRVYNLSLYGSCDSILKIA